MQALSIQAKIVLLFVLLISVSFLATSYVVLKTNKAHIQEDMMHQLLAGVATFEKMLILHRQTFFQMVTILVQEESFQKAVKSRNVSAIFAHITQHIPHKNVEASWKVVEGSTALAESSKRMLSTRTFACPSPSLETSEVGVTVFAQELYQTIQVPIFEAKNSTWLCIHFWVDDVWLHELSQTTHLDYAFLQQTKETRWRVIASNLNEVFQQVLIDEVTTQTLPLAQKPKEVVLYKQKWLLVPSVFSEQPTTLIGFFLLPLESADEVMAVLELRLAGLFLSAVLIFFFVSWWLAKGVTSPLRLLLSKIKDMTASSKIEPLKLNLPSEIAELAEEFNRMQKVIQKREREIQYRAFYDHLTGLANRNFFQERLGETLKLAHQNQSKISILVMDIDRFKEINDTLGYHTGDQLLKQLAQRLSYAFRHVNLIARMGGNEFALLLPNTSEQEVATIAEQVQEIFNKPFGVGGLALELTIRMGIALYPDHAKNTTLLLQKANIAMEQARDKQSHFRIYDQELDKHSVLRLSIMGELKSAVKNNELVLYYQPKVDLIGSAVTQVEALVRWIHPKHGLINPEAFVPIAEQTGHVRYLTQWALQSALKQCYEWQSLNIPLQASVNISTVDLMDVQLVHKIEQLFNTISVPPKCLMCEVTESAIMKDPKRAITVLNGLSAMGIQLSIDDFGTGYSSMAQLKKLPVQEIKIDRSFITHMLVDRNDEIIVKSTIELGHNLGLQVVGEGVDDEKIFERLKSLKCDRVQGHYISPPLSITEFSKWLLHQSKP
ncbi:MAG: EAL domain-containing protein [Gammaproteobacteria bacterium]|nr:EAL domain-containing protein [Gammaproteobacteria bacterium]